jgi:hypothetical protein
MGNIKNFLVSLISDTKSKLLVAGFSIVVLLFFLNRWNYSKLREAEEKVARIENNLAAAQDTIRITRAKNNELEYNKRIYIASSKKELKALSDSLAKQVEITKGDVIAIANIGFKVKHDSIYIPTTVYVEDSIVKIRSKIDTVYSNGNFRALAFESTYKAKEGKAFSIITEDAIGFTATVGIKQNEKKQYEIFVRPHYPGMQVGRLEGAIIQDALVTKTETKIPLVTIGASAGLVPLTYDWNTRKVDVNLNRVGVSLGFNFNLGAIFK